MSLWDGLTTGDDMRIVVLGATNRPNDIDSAILRRMPKRFAVRLPSEDQRRSILELLLQDIKLAPDFDMDELLKRTADCSGSDLKELCRNAAMIPIREYVRSVQKDGDGTDGNQLLDVDIANINTRPLTLADFYSYDETNSKTYSYSRRDADTTVQQENLD